jgi:predicted CXXCH cytochrome family protein
MDVSCVSCHSVHNNDNDKMLVESTEAETCYGCHAEQRVFTLKRSSHPISDIARFDNSGEMNCTSCHNPHGSQSESLISANTVNDKCYECHQEMKAPVLWRQKNLGCVSNVMSRVGIKP